MVAMLLPLPSGCGLQALGPMCGTQEGWTARPRAALCLS